MGRPRPGEGPGTTRARGVRTRGRTFHAPLGVLTTATPTPVVKFEERSHRCAQDPCPTPSEMSEPRRCRAVFLPADPARTGRVAFCPPDGEALPSGGSERLGPAQEPAVVLPGEGGVGVVRVPAVVLPAGAALPVLTRACHLPDPRGDRLPGRRCPPGAPTRRTRSAAARCERRRPRRAAPCGVRGQTQAAMPMPSAKPRHRGTAARRRARRRQAARRLGSASRDARLWFGVSFLPSGVASNRSRSDPCADVIRTMARMA